MTDPKSTLRAVAHPLRLQMLSLLTGAELSAAEVARELDITHANASYHLRVLLDAGEVEVASEEKIRGGVARRYRHPWRTTAPATHPDARDARLSVRAFAEELVRRFDDRADGPTILTDAELWVNPETWQRVRDLLTEASYLLHDEARPPRTDGTTRVNLTVAAFEMEAR